MSLNGIELFGQGKYLWINVLDTIGRPSSRTDVKTWKRFRRTLFEFNSREYCKFYRFKLFLIHFINLDYTEYFYSKPGEFYILFNFWLFTEKLMKIFSNV